MSILAQTILCLTWMLQSMTCGKEKPLMSNFTHVQRIYFSVPSDFFRFLSLFHRCNSTCRSILPCHGSLDVTAIDVRCVTAVVVSLHGGVTAMHASLQWMRHCNGCVTAMDVSLQWMCHCNGCVTAVVVSLQWMCRGNGCVTAMDVSLQ